MNYFVLALFSIWPFLSFIAHNINKGIFVKEILNLYIGVLFFLFITYTILKNLTKKNNKSLSIIIFLYIMFFMFSVFGELMGESLNTYQTFVWGLVNVVGAFFIWKTPNEKSLYNFYAMILFLFYVVPIVNFSKYTYSLESNDLNLSAGENFPDIKGVKPNVYFFILDAYARPDVLNKNFSHDSAGFLSKLENNSFFIASSEPGRGSP